MIRAVVYDLDDTLYPERQFVLGGYHAVAARVQKDLKVRIDHVLCRLFDDGVRRDIFTKALMDKGILADEAYVKQLVEVYRSHDPTLKLYSDSWVLSEFHSRGIPQGLITDGWADVQWRKIRSLGLDEIIESIVVSDELGGKACWKPSTKPYVKVLNELNVNPAEAIYVGDNPAKDFKGAKELGMATARIRRKGGEHETEEPIDEANTSDCEISSLDELLKLEIVSPRSADEVPRAQQGRIDKR